MKIYKKKKKIIIEIPLLQESFNPYDDSSYILDNVIGVIAGEEYGFCSLIDMSYKGKESQIGDWFVKFSEIQENTVGDRREKIKWFTELCDRLGVELFIYPTCKSCKKVIYGSYTWGDKGETCWDCNKS